MIPALVLVFLTVIFRIGTALVVQGGGASWLSSKIQSGVALRLPPHSKISFSTHLWTIAWCSGSPSDAMARDSASAFSRSDLVSLANRVFISFASSLFSTASRWIFAPCHCACPGKPSVRLLPRSVFPSNTYPTASSPSARLALAVKHSVVAEYPVMTKGLCAVAPHWLSKMR